MTEPDDVTLASCATDLATAIEAALPVWVMRCVTRRCQNAGVPVDDSVLGAASVAGIAAARRVGAEASMLLATDIDDQSTTPLELVRAGVRHPTAVLRSVGVPPSARDEFARRAFPEDDYDLAPATLADLDESLREPALRWGAAKAHVHLARRRAEGQR